jgi:hypothetical protein
MMTLSQTTAQQIIYRWHEDLRRELSQFVRAPSAKHWLVSFRRKLDKIRALYEEGLLLSVKRHTPFESYLIKSSNRREIFQSHLKKIIFPK